jgi:hypothetical protein
MGSRPSNCWTISVSDIGMRPPCHIASLWSERPWPFNRLLTPRTVLSNKKSVRDFYVTQQSFSASYRRRLDARSLRRDSQAWAAFERTIRRTPSRSSGPQIKAIQRIPAEAASADGRPGYASTKQISRERSPGEPLHTPPTACHSNGRPAFGKRQWRLSPIPRTVLERAYQLRGHPR